MEHSMTLEAAPFEKIKSGQKTVEMRLYDEKRRALSVGDTITFRNREDGERLQVKVEGLFVYPSFQELYQHFSLAQLGYGKKEEEGASFRDMERYYSCQQQRENQVVGIAIRLVGEEGKKQKGAIEEG